MILKWIFKKSVGRDSMNWTDLAQDREKQWVLVNMVMNLMFIKYGKFPD
jgi:hypothetical protein